MLVECPYLTEVLCHFVSEDLFKSVNNRNTIDFIKETHFRIKSCFCYLYFIEAK